MTTLTQRIEHAIADKGLGIGDAWNLLGEALEYITAQQRTIELQGNEVRSLVHIAQRYEWLKGQFKVMSPHMDGQHYWHLTGMSKFKGSSIDAICDTALSAQRGGE
jgi:hypothetical protein